MGCKHEKDCELHKNKKCIGDIMLMKASLGVTYETVIHCKLMDVKKTAENLGISIGSKSESELKREMLEVVSQPGYGSYSLSPQLDIERIIYKLETQCCLGENEIKYVTGLLKLTPEYIRKSLGVNSKEVLDGFPE
jgi:hypothetical protein